MNTGERMTYKTDYDVGLNHKDYTAIDIETTGLEPETDEIIELAAVRYRDGKEVDRFQSLVKPKSSISEFIENLTGINDTMVSNAPGIADILPSYLLFLGDDVLLGHNIKFDMGFIDEATESLDLELLSNKWNDTMLLSRDIFKGERSHKLKDLCSRLNIPELQEHRALSDCIRTHLCYEAMREYSHRDKADVQETNNTKIDDTENPFVNVVPCSTAFDWKTVHSLNDAAFNDYLVSYSAYVFSLSADDPEMPKAGAQVAMLKEEQEARYEFLGWDENKVKSLDDRDLLNYSRKYIEYTKGYADLSKSIVKMSESGPMVYSMESIDAMTERIHKNGKRLQFIQEEMARRKNKKGIGNNNDQKDTKLKQFLSFWILFIGIPVSAAGLGLFFFDYKLPGAIAFVVGIFFLIVSYFNQ